ncbi:hypothetical protein [Glycomyces albidus]|jgi:hypothetical protein|uniref:Uncharacterized protein n=1 Tax=Glycomyces albidus TaxID=2656774 RepID=A0A6L5G9K6_9ACTN|nr:hypothetical protein [Glycomyces albidus]MQM26379.1 hypothetical protein [Glycomyces albidus]
MDPYAFIAVQLIKSDAGSALPDAPVVEDRPSLMDRIVGGFAAAKHGFIARELRVRGELAALPTRAEVRRAA